MPETDTQQMQAGKKSRKKLIILGIVIAVLICTAAFGVYMALRPDGKPASAPGSSAPAANVAENVVTGTGIIEAKEQFDITASVTGEIVAAPFEEGQQVAAGDVLFQIDSANVKSAVDKSALAVEKAQLAYNQAADNLRKLNVAANATGTVTQLYAREGDMVGAGGKLADIVNDETMILKVPFLEDSVGSLYAGQSAQVTIVGTFYSVTGTVSKIASGRMVSADGSAVRLVEIVVANPGALKKGDKGTAVAGGVACHDAGEFAYGDEKTVYSELAGKIGSLPYKVGDHIGRGDVLARLTNDTYATQQEQNSLAIRDAQLALETQRKALQDYTVTSPIAGTVLTKTKKQGELLDMTSKGPLATVADLSNILFKMDVDELDITKVQAGQRVDVTSDAFLGQPFTGVVDSISTAGKQISGVTLYEVTVRIPDAGGLLPGMNVNAKIRLDQQQEAGE